MRAPHRCATIHSGPLPEHGLIGSICRPPVAGPEERERCLPPSAAKPVGLQVRHGAGDLDAGSSGPARDSAVNGGCRAGRAGGIPGGRRSLMVDIKTDTKRGFQGVPEQIMADLISQ